MEHSNNKALTDDESDLEEYQDVNEEGKSQFAMAQCSVDSTPTPTKKKNRLSLFMKKLGGSKEHDKDRGHSSAQGAESSRHIEDITDESLYGQRESNEIRVVLVGRTGSGKSATGNLLLSCDQFESHPSGESVTRQCKTGTGRYLERKIVVVDTPGMFDTKLAREQISKEIIRCIHMSLPGPHLFLLVVAIGRFTNEEIETLNHLFDLFGSEMGNFAAITFTRLDDLENHNTTIEAYIETAPKPLKEFLKRCKNQYVAINNEAKKKNRDTQIRKLLSQIDSVKQRNNGSYYTNEMYKTAEANLQQRVQEVKRTEQLKKQKEVKQIESKFVKEIKTVKDTNEKLLKEVKMKEAKQVQIKKDQAQYKEDMEKMKAEMKKIDKKTQKELYEAKKREKKEKEEQINLLKIKDNEIKILLDQHRKEQIEMNQERIELEKKRKEDILQYKENYEQKMNQHMNQILEQNNTNFEAMQKENQNLRDELTQQKNTFSQLMYTREKESKKKEQERKIKDKEREEANASQTAYLRKMTNELSKMNKATEEMASKYQDVEYELAAQRSVTEEQDKKLSNIALEKDKLQQKEREYGQKIEALNQQNAKLEKDLKEKCSIS